MIPTIAIRKTVTATRNLSNSSRNHFIPSALSAPFDTLIYTKPESDSSPGLLTLSPFNTSNIPKLILSNPDSSSASADYSSGARSSAWLNAKRLTYGLYFDNLYGHDRREERAVIFIQVQTRCRRPILGSKNKRQQ